MQKWGKRPIYFKNAEIMQNALIMQTLRPLKCNMPQKVWIDVLFQGKSLNLPITMGVSIAITGTIRIMCHFYSVTN